MRSRWSCARVTKRRRAGAPTCGCVLPAPAATGSLFAADAERGLCRVLSFPPRHDSTLARMDLASIRTLVEAWIDEWAAMAVHPWVKYALVFENPGEMMGASNPHPPGQIWAT